MGETWKDSGVGHNKNQKQIRSDQWSKDEGHKSSSWLTDGHLSSEKCRIWGKAPKIQKSSCTLGYHRKRCFTIIRSIYWTRIISTTSDSHNSHGHHIKTIGMRRTSSGFSIYWNLEMEDAPKLLKIPKSECPDVLDTSTKAPMAKIMVQFDRPSRSSWAESVRSSFGRTITVKAIWENPIETWLGENSKLGMSLCTSWKRIILICVCGWHKIGWKEIKSWSDVETTQKRNRFGRTNIFPWPSIVGLDSKTMWNKHRYCWQLRNHGWIQNFSRINWNNSMLGKSVCLFMVLWHGSSCEEMCGAIL